MTPQQMATEAVAAIRRGTRMAMVMERDKNTPPGFPSGRLRRYYNDRHDVYSYDPNKVLEWLNANRLVAVEVLTPNAKVSRAHE